MKKISKLGVCGFIIGTFPANLTSIYKHSMKFKMNTFKHAASSFFGIIKLNSCTKLQMVIKTKMLKIFLSCFQTHSCGI